MQWIRNVVRLFGLTRRLVGTDLEGNKYYEVVRSGGHAGHHANRTKREVVTKLKHDQYTSETIPVEWEAWIRGKRKDPPTHEDIQKRQIQQNMLQKKIQQVEDREQERQAREYAEGLVARSAQRTSNKPVGHASAPVYENLDLKSEPTSTGKNFQPAAWSPGKKSSHGGEGQADHEDTYEPEPWTPPSGEK